MIELSSDALILAAINYPLTFPDSDPEGYANQEVPYSRTRYAENLELASDNLEPEYGLLHGLTDVVSLAVGSAHGSVEEAKLTYNTVVAYAVEIAGMSLRLVAEGVGTSHAAIGRIVSDKQTVERVINAVMGTHGSELRAIGVTESSSIEEVKAGLALLRARDRSRVKLLNDGE